MPKIKVVKKILVVDDSDTVRQQIRHALTSAGFEVIEACDGLDGLTKCRLPADLAAVLCDVNMPVMDGLELITSARSEGLSLPSSC